MKIKSIKNVGKMPVYDLSINSNNYDEQHYVLENGVVTHNIGSYYGSDNIWILGRQQEKVDNEISGYHFVINVEKSRYVKEKSKIPITVSFEGGINRWSGLLELAIEGNYIVKPKAGWYAVVDQETGEIQEPSKRAKDIVDNGDFWKEIFTKTDFAKFLETKYKISIGPILGDEDEGPEASE